MDVPLVVLDREIRRAHEAASAPRSGPNALEPHRRVSCRTTWLELGECEGDPLAAAARWHVGVLTLERVLWADAARVEEARLEPTVVLSDPRTHEESPREVVRALLAEPSPERRARLADALERGSGGVADAARRLAERRAEAAQRLDPVLWPTLHLPFEPHDAAETIAHAFLERTGAMSPRASTWHDALGLLVARDAGEGWPAHLTPRWITELFRGTGLLDGLSLAPETLPPPVGAASFARALRGFGEAFARADVPSGAPFSLARPPFDVRAARRGGLFASLAADPVFFKRALGLSRSPARDQARKVARSLCLSLRLDAARVLLDGALAAEARERDARWEEATARALGVPIPPSLAGVLPRLGPNDATRFAGAVLAAADRRALVERTDEDWFESPHAARLLREQNATLPASPRARKDELASALEVLVADLESAID